MFNTAHHPDFQFGKHRLGKTKAFSLKITMAVVSEIGPSGGGVRMKKGGEEQNIYVQNAIKSVEITNKSLCIAYMRCQPGTAFHCLLKMS